MNVPVPAFIFTMNLRRIADRNVFPIGLGAMALDEYKPKPSYDEAVSLIKYAVDKGIGFIDTADVYGLGRNEQILGDALNEEQKEKVIIATKVGCTRPNGHGWDTNGSPLHIMEGVKESLQRLKIKRIYIYQLHAPDHRVPFKESIKAMKELQEQKLVKHVGLSNVTLGELQEAQQIIDVVSVENHYNLAFKRDEIDLLPYLTEQKIAYLPYFPLGSGKLLTNIKLIKIAQRLNSTPSQIALSWILHKWPTAIPIPGTRNKLHLDENLKAANIDLPKKIINELDSMYFQ